MTTAAASPTTPHADRPRMPAGYGVPKTTKGLLEWATVEGWLDAARVFWISTVGPDGQPRVRPVDGLYIDGTLYVGGSPETRWVRDLHAHPKASINLGGSDDVLIIEGSVEFAGLPAELARRVAAASNEKYGYGMSEADYTGPGVIAIHPRIAYAWSGGLTNMTRFRFGG